MYNMAIIENQIKKWGNSYGFIIPAEIVKMRNLKTGQTLKIKIEPKIRVDAFGIFRGAKHFKEEKISMVASIPSATSLL